MNCAHLQPTAYAAICFLTCFFIKELDPLDTYLSISPSLFWVCYSVHTVSIFWLLCHTDTEYWHGICKIILLPLCLEGSFLEDGCRRWDSSICTDGHEDGDILYLLERAIAAAWQLWVLFSLVHISLWTQYVDHRSSSQSYWNLQVFYNERVSIINKCVTICKQRVKMWIGIEIVQLNGSAILW